MVHILFWNFLFLLYILFCFMIFIYDYEILFYTNMSQYKLYVSGIVNKNYVW